MLNPQDHRLGRVADLDGSLRFVCRLFLVGLPFSGRGLCKFTHIALLVVPKDASDVLERDAERVGEGEPDEDGEEHGRDDETQIEFPADGVEGGRGHLGPENVDGGQ